METGTKEDNMHCKNCGHKITESYTDFAATYLGYVERYVNCWECKSVTVFRYELKRTVGGYPMSRHEDNSEKEKCYHENKNLKVKATLHKI